MFNRRGFTVIELLTVIAMIGILIAIMQPMLVNSSGKSREMLCESNLKHIGVGVEAYAEDYQVFPSTLGKVDTILQDRNMLHCPNRTEAYYYVAPNGDTDREALLASCINPSLHSGMPHRSATCYLELSAGGRVRRVMAH